MRRRKTSEAQRKLNAKKAMQRYREKNRELDLESNRKLIALRRKDEKYHFQERIKNIEYIRKKRQSKKKTTESFRIGERLIRKRLVAGFKDGEHKRKEKSNEQITKDIKIPKRLPERLAERLPPRLTSRLNADFQKVENNRKEKSAVQITKDIKIPKRLPERLAERLTARLAAKLVSHNTSDDPIPVRNEIDRKETKKLSYSVLKAYKDNCEHFPELENYYLQKDSQREIKSEMNKNLKPKNSPRAIQIYISATEFCIPVPLKKTVKFNPNAVKRGRGRPRKDSLASNISNPHNSSFLEEDLQCSTDDDEDGFQEVSEDENNPSSFLDQGERLHSGVNEDGSELIDAANIKTEMKIEPTQIGEDDSMDLDPNYDPSDFLTMHNRMGNTESNQQQQQDNKMSQFLQQDEAQNDNVQTINDNKPSMHQMPLMMGSNDNMGIDDDLAISESDEEDEGNVRVKREIFTDQMDDEQQQQQQQQQHSMMDMQMQQQQQQQQEQLPLQPYTNIDQQQQQQHHQVQNQSSHHDDNNDDDWLRF